MIGLEMPKGATMADMEAHIEEAVVGWGGAFPVSDPRHNIKAVTVTPLRKPRRITVRSEIRTQIISQ